MSLIEHISKMFAGAETSRSTTRYATGNKRQRYPAKRYTPPDLGFEVKSKMEANIYRYYRWLCKGGKIVKVEYEPERFNLHKNPLNIHAYVPDLKITTSHNYYYIEVKGVADIFSVKKASLFQQDYPWLKLFFIHPKQYDLIKRHFSKSIPFWEN